MYLHVQNLCGFAGRAMLAPPNDGDDAPLQTILRHCEIGTGTAGTAFSMGSLGEYQYALDCLLCGQPL